MASFLETFLDPATEALLAKALCELRPDVVHIHHSLNLGSGAVSAALRAGAAVVATAHDFWPICQRIDLRRPDGAQCPGPAGGLRCAACLPELLRAGTSGGRPRSARRMGRGLLLAGARLFPYLLRTQLVQGCYARAQRLTCPASFVADLLVRAGFDRERLVIVDYGIPPLDAAVAAVPRPRSPLRLGYLGTLGSHKGVEIALRALELVPAETASLIVAGGPLREEGLARALEAGARAGRVEYRGPYDKRELPGLLAEMDALIIPSLWPETGPMVWMEATSAGLPVIASRIGALEQRVRDSEDGLLVQPGDCAALARAIRRLAADYAAFRQAALSRPIRSVNQAASELLAVYAEALSEVERHPPGRRWGSKARIGAGGAAGGCRPGSSNAAGAP